jgi:nucleoside-diphosphate kinase
VRWGLLERTLIIVKPDAVKRRLTGRILAFIEENGLRIIGMRMVRLTGEEAGAFYAVHRGKEFYENLVSYMTSGQCVPAAVEGEDAIRRVRGLCGNTDPRKADRGTIRAAYGLNVTMNSIHASDSPATAREEVGFFFPDLV